MDEQKEVLVGTIEGVENKYLIKFQKPYTFESKAYEEIDISAIEDISASDMIRAQKVMEQSGGPAILPEMSLEYACIISANATKMPVEFFKNLPAKEAIKLKNRVTSFFYAED